MPVDTLASQFPEEPSPEGLEVDVANPTPSDMQDLPDGGAIVITHEERTTVSVGFEANMALEMDASKRRRIASDLLDLLERDAESRRKRDEDYEEGLRRSGLDRGSSVGANFEGASRAVHPVLAKAAIDFEARAIKELFPANGPVRVHILGDGTKAKVSKAERKRDYLNWQLTKQMPEYRRELEQLLSQLSLAGSQFLKFYWDGGLGRAVAEYVPSDKIRLPFSASCWQTARRKAHVLDLTSIEVKSRIASGMYLDAPYGDPALLPEASKAQEEADRIEGKEDSGYNVDGLRRLYETYVWLDLGADDPVAEGLAPYIVTVDETSGDCLAIYRNWNEGAACKRELAWIVEWPFIPWRGALTAGLVHLIGGLAVAATGALNALLDSAHVNNAPTAVCLKGSRLSGQSKQLEPTTVQYVEGPVGLDDIRKLMMPLPYNPPSPVLVQLLGWLTEQAEGVVTTASERLADASNTGPVGTTYALIEQGSVVISAIHGRLHAAQAECLEILCRLNARYLSDSETVEELGELTVSREDFEGPQDVIPVSDPNIFCEAQRWAQLQAVQQLSQDPRIPYDVHALHKRMLDLLKVPQPEELLPDKPESEPTNPVAENVNATRGLGLKTFPFEDHIAHLRVHLSFLTDPDLQMVSRGAVWPLAMHIQEHLVLLYAGFMQTVASQAVGKDVTAYMMDAQSQREVDGLLAEAAPHAHELFKTALGPMQPALAQLQQLAAQAQQAQNPPTMDPASQVAMQVGMAEVNRKVQADQQTSQFKQMELQQKAQIEQQRLQAETFAQQAKLEADALKAHLDAGLAKVRIENDRLMARFAAMVKLELAELQSKTALRQEQLDAAMEADRNISEGTLQIPITGV